MNERVQCRTCEMIQPPGPICRRCGRTLPANLVKTVEVIREIKIPVVEKVLVPAPCVQCGHNAEHVPSIEEMERSLIIAAMTLYAGDKQLVRMHLGISKTTLYRKLHEYGIREPK